MACLLLLSFFNSKQPTAATSQLADPNEAENNSESAEKRFEVLTKAFQSLTEKKSKMEIAFQADKKLLIVNCKYLILSFLIKTTDLLYRVPFLYH